VRVYLFAVIRIIGRDLRTERAIPRDVSVLFH